MYFMIFVITNCPIYKKNIQHTFFFIMFHCLRGIMMAKIQYISHFELRKSGVAGMRENA